MTQPQQQPPRASKPPFAAGSIIWRRVGPLPVWAWSLIGIGLAVIALQWRRNRAEAEVQPSDQHPYVWAIPPAMPPRVTLPIEVVVPQPPQLPTTPPATPPAGGTTPPYNPPVYVGEGGGGYVTVTPFPDNTPPRESTLWDIAGTWLGDPQRWPEIWHHDRNAGIRASRGVPAAIQPGDQIWVPGKRAEPFNNF